MESVISMIGNSPPIKEKYINNEGHFHYRACGLDNVYLSSGYNISEDGKKYSISNMNQLHQCIAENLIHETRQLSGKELRFVRKEIGITQSLLGRRMGVDTQTVARWEKEETVNNMADRMLRVMYLTSTVEVGDDVNTLLDSIGDLDAEHRQWVFDQKEKREWKKCG